MKRPSWLAVSVSALTCLVLVAGFSSAVHAQGLPYPAYTPYEIKGVGIEPRDADRYFDVIGNKTGGIVTNLPWLFYQPVLDPAPCTNPGMPVAFDGYCFAVEPNNEYIIQTFSSYNVMVTGILLGTPDWARISPCNKPPLEQLWCGTAPGYSAHFGRFAKFIANRYNGLNGVGRVVNFVIHNEVGSPWAYFTDECGTGIPGSPATCTVNAQVARYAADYNQAYDGIKSQQAAAKVLVSIGGYFQGPDNPNPPSPGVPVPGITIPTYLTTFHSYAGGRAWQLAVHAYNMSDVSPVHSVDDPQITPGSIGKLTGWLRRQFPSTPSAWEVHMTENGIHGEDADNGALQAQYLCKAFENVIGSPGVESYLYTPLQTHGGYGASRQELIKCTLLPDGSCQPGSHSYRWSWQTWALANRIDVGLTSCGFENLPYTKLSRYVNASRGHIATTRVPPAGSGLEGAWKLFRAEQPGTHPLYECNWISGANFGPGAEHTFVDRSYTCAGFMKPMGLMGYAYDSAGAGRVALNRCYVNAPGWEDHFVSTSPTCEGWLFEETLGYVIP